MAFEYLRPRLLVRDGWLIRKAGLFYKRRINLKEVTQITAHNKDAVTHDEVVVCLSGGGKRVFFASEFDHGFEHIMRVLGEEFSGMKPYAELLVGKPFRGDAKILWKRVEQGS